ncbi:DNA mismatch repair endonuclease MutL [Motilimonas pumila]|uniref:DNA mismatch repair protein MutL n=1 Tax=Motilimonas pumila TaxID=2303987 RepID=A0A418YA88_9GAMM|nr:DNA mismatch repair endonuclease MutL [Motilimonas pumila]RJG39457.1 DNA mismatch repair endonuclease MutL [Motilimonas pumila]
MSIQILPARLANQIAAGEVVERPASVVKELVENSLDAGATKIEVELQQGGAKSILIRDNGCGVDKAQLELALSRHATSKLTSLDDLEAIVSLGFRGEALASISSVSRLAFSSKPAQQPQAWQAIAEGRDMQVQVQPTAHPNGTSVEVADLFFNTPARRRFLKSEKTEFSHIDTLIKRLALSHFEVHFILKHNGKVVRNFRPATTLAQKEKRVAAICSGQFMQHALAVEACHGDIRVSGWIVEPSGARGQNDAQYCYVNGRMMRDKLINHAIRQAYAEQLPSELFAAYVLYIDLPPSEVDVNVHPAKHEVRFHQSRLVHDFILQTLQSALKSTQGQANGTQLNVASVREVAAESSSWHSSSHVDASGTASHPVEQYNAYPNSDLTSDGSGQSNTSAYATAAAHPGKHQYQGGQQVSQADIARYSALLDTRDTLSDEALSEAAQTSQITQAYTAGEAVKQQKPVGEHEPLPWREGESQHSTAATPVNLPQNASSELGKPIALVEPNYVLLQRQELCILSLPHGWRYVCKSQLLGYWHQGGPSQPLLLPLSIKVGESLAAVAEFHLSSLNKLGIGLKSPGRGTIIVTKVPPQMREVPLADVIAAMVQFLQSYNDVLKGDTAVALCDFISVQLMAHKSFNQWSQAELLLQQLTPILTQQPDLLALITRPLNITATIKEFSL